MERSWIKRTLPRSLYGRAALILIVPILTVQLVVSVVFIQRHFEGVTRQMSRNVLIEMTYLLDLINDAADPAAALAAVAPPANALRYEVILPFEGTQKTSRLIYDLSGVTVLETLTEGMRGFVSADMATNSRQVRVEVDTRNGPALMVVDRRRLSASNPHQLLVLMLATSLLMTIIAFLFLRNQLRPIKRLARAAEAFGKGQPMSYRPTGATEVRAAGSAFMEMRARIERHIEQRTMMLSGVSHDLRTPLTRLKLSLSLANPNDETANMQRDVNDMERILDTFLDFARSDALDALQEVNPGDILQRVAERSISGGGDVTIDKIAIGVTTALHELAIERALQNLIDNALRYGNRARVGMCVTDRTVRFEIEDDGPGIPADQREAALKAFNRLDTARNQDKGSGVGLGLAIAADIARSHGGLLRMGDSHRLGGLKVDLIIAR